MSYSKGISWIDDTRIPFVDDVNLEKKLPIQNGGTIYGGGKGFYRTEEITEYKSGGRFTPNLLVCDDMLNDGSVVKSSNNWSKKTTLQSPYFTDDKQEIQKDTSYGDKGTNSRYYNLDLWFDVMLDKL